MAPAHVQIDDRNPLSEYTRAIGLLLEIQNSRGVDLSVLVDVLRAFSALPENKVLRPRAFEYPDRAAMEVAIAVAIDLMDVKTGTWERVAKALPVIITLYELHGMRVEAIAAYNARLPTIPGALWPPVSIEPNVPEAELYRADDRVRVLHPIDAVVGHFYEAFNHGELIDSALMVVVDFVYQMVSHHGPDQEISLQPEPAFFDRMQRPASQHYLAFVYLSTQFDFPPEVISPAQVLRWAEMQTAPFRGAAEQDKFICRLFPTNTFRRDRYLNLPQLTKTAIRDPNKVWPALQGHCLWCGQTGAKYSCKPCGRISYCDVDCQTSHWNSSHKAACKMYRLVG